MTKNSEIYYHSYSQYREDRIALPDIPYDEQGLGITHRGEFYPLKNAIDERLVYTKDHKPKNTIDPHFEFRYCTVSDLNLKEDIVLEFLFRFAKKSITRQSIIFKALEYTEMSDQSPDNDLKSLLNWALRSKLTEVSTDNNNEKCWNNEKSWNDKKWNDKCNLEELLINRERIL